MSDEMMHYGILRKSGRYPWGSGDSEYQRSMDFYAITNEMKSAGVPEAEIAKAVGLSVQDLRSTRTIAKEEVVREQTQRAVQLREKGVSIQKIGEDLGLPAPTVRLRLKNSENMKESSLRKTANVIRNAVDKHNIVDVGKGVDIQLGIADTKLNAALSVLRDEGYETYNVPVKNVGTKHFTNQRVIVPPGTGFGGARRMTDQIHTMGDYTEDDGLTYFGIAKPLSVSAKRVQPVYDSPEDGTVYLRRGVKDLDMGKNHYAQVRIQVGPGHYIKGMALYKDDLPPGVDIQVHTNKKSGTPLLGDKDNSVLKLLKRDVDGNIDQDNPFGSMIKRQLFEKGKDGVERVKSALNIVNEEGDWDTWRKSLPSQFLAKQPHSLIKSQLDVTRTQLQDRLNDINKITNPVVRRKKLEDFAEQVDSDAVDLRAASMPRQRTQVIIPAPVKKGEIYAPNFETGEKVVLVRYPHGGRFEIPEVTVNNNARGAKRLLGNAVDAIGIHPDVAERLSGADFDGDTVVVIPNRGGTVKGSQSMGSQAKVFDDQLGSFNPKVLYGGYQETNGKGNYPLMKNTGLEMGKITNLITDMSIQGARPEHVVRAVKHSMVVIDAEKHRLNYKKSEEDNNIAQLRELYQSSRLPDGSVKVGGASTLLSRATAKERVPEFKDRPQKQGGPINPDTGAKITVPTGKMRNAYDPKTRTYTDEKVPVMTKVKRLALTDDARTLVRDPSDPVEKLYADHANAMKDLANQARLQAYRTPNPKTNTQAKAVYKDEVDRLNADLLAAERQLPLNRRADVIAGSVVKAKRQEDPTLRLDRDRLQKVERQAKAAARARLGLKQPVIDIDDRQWDAIQSGAVSPSRLERILKYADPKRVDDLSMPRPNTVMSSAISARAKAMLAAGATNADVAAALGIPLSTLRSAQLRGDV